MLIYKQGNIFESGEKFLAHGCNCKKSMGAGIAKQVRERYPNAYKADQATIWGDKNKLGSFTFGIEEDGVMVFNAYTQFDYSRTHRCVDYGALEKAINKIAQTVKIITVTEGAAALAMPKIGCGLGGGDWNIVSGILERISNAQGIDFHIYEWNPSGRRQ